MCRYANNRGHLSLIIALIGVLWNGKLLHCLDKLVFIELLIAIRIVLRNKLEQLGLESLRLLDLLEGVLVIGKSANDLIHGQELVTVGIQTAER